MATIALFAQLKLRLLAGNLRGDVQRKIGFVLTLLLAAGLAALGFLLMSLLRLAAPDVAADLVTLAFTALLAGWMIVPLLAFGVDDTVDPAKLALLPLRTPRLAVGMFTASVIGVWPAALLIMTLGALVGLASGAGGWLIGLLAVLVQFALCVVASRLITTALSSALRTRRGRDVLAVAALLVVLLAQLPNLLLNSGFADPGALLHRLAGALRWTPPGMLAHAISDGGLLALAEVVLVALLTVVLAVLWIKALSRALVTPGDSVKAATVRRESGLIDRFLPDGPLAAVVTKELKYIRREPRYRVGWVSAIALTVILAFSLTRGGTGGSGTAIALASIAAGMITLQSVNAFGIDGRSIWMNAVASGDERGLATDLAGRHLASALIAVPLIAVIATGAALFTGHPSAIPPALLAGWGVLGIGLGVGSVTSVVLPYTVPERMNAFTGAAPGQGGLAFASAMGAMVAISVLSLPFVVPMAFGLTWASVLAPFYGLLMETLGRRLAARVGFRRTPELLAAVSRPT